MAIFALWDAVPGTMLGCRSNQWTSIMAGNSAPLCLLAVSVLWRTEMNQAGTRVGGHRGLREPLQWFSL